MEYDFDRVIDRRGQSNSIKWHKYAEDILPLWVADMDFAAPVPIQEALHKAAMHGVFGYEMISRQMGETVAARLDRLYGWKIPPEMVVATPGVIAGFNAAATSVCSAGEGILVQPPVYPPFLTAHEKKGLIRQDAALQMTAENSLLKYGVDFDGFERAVNSSDAKTGMFLLCNPHNPTGQVFSDQVQMCMAEICLKNNVFICSDEIHSELTLGESQHIPIATLSPEIADRTITLIAPSKTFNIPGLLCGFAILPNRELLKQYKKTMEQMSLHTNSLGLVAAQAAFSGECEEWLIALRAYLKENRDFLIKTIELEFQGIKVTVPEATYLAWLDCSEAAKSGRITGNPQAFFLNQAKVGLSDGKEFGPGGEGFVRLNFGCPRKTLEDALERMKTALT